MDQTVVHFYIVSVCVCVCRCFTNLLTVVLCVLADNVCVDHLRCRRHFRVAMSRPVYLIIKNMNIIIIMGSCSTGGLM